MTPGAGEFGEPPQGIRTLTPTPIHVEEAVLDDLRRRLSSVRWPVDAGNDDEYYGVSRTRLEPLVEYWRDEYDRRRAEAEINRFEHYFLSWVKRLSALEPVSAGRRVGPSSRG